MAEKFLLEKMANLHYMDINIIPIVKNYIYETKTKVKNAHIGLGSLNVKMMLKYRTRYGVKDGPYNEYPLCTKKFINDNKNECLIERGNYTNGKLQGKRTVYYLSGQISKEEFYKEGKRNGVFKEFDEQGNLTHQYEYNNGVIAGESLWFYPNGIVRERWNYQPQGLDYQPQSPSAPFSGALHGTAGCDYKVKRQLYWENGQLYKVTGNVGEKPHGEIKERYDNGNIMSITLYNKGEIIDEKRFHKDGRQMEKVGNVMWL